MSTVAIGFFDGVHLGHRKILAGADIAVTFKNHPLTVLNAAKAPRLIMCPEDRLAAIKSCGVREILALDFTPELATLSPEQFLAKLHLHLLSSPEFSFRCGANWRFGKGAEGSPDWFRNHGIRVEVIEAAVYDNAPVSSTRIRECLVRGEIAAANAMLGRRYLVRGERVKGKGEGTKLGYPTVNLAVSGLSLPHGVYQVEIEGCRALANFGFAPTFADRAWKEPVLEIHFVESSTPNLRSSEVSAREIEVEFLRFIRPERKFDSPEALKRQIASDVAGVIR